MSGRNDRRRLADLISISAAAISHCAEHIHGTFTPEDLAPDHVFDEVRALGVEMIELCDRRAAERQVKGTADG